jgi:large-conductance mechanosensitive channel
VLPDSVPSHLLSAPVASTATFIAVAIAFMITFFVLFLLISFSHKMGKVKSTFQKPMFQRISAWIGVFGFIVGEYGLFYS